MAVNAFHIREVAQAFGRGKQTDIATAQLVAAMWSVTKTNQVVTSPSLINETDAQDLGRGDEFASASYPSRVDVTIPFETYTTAELVAWASCFGMGAYVKTGTPNFTYTCTPLNQITFGRELPYFTYAESVRQAAGASAAWDLAFVGCMLSSFNVKLVAGPTRASSTMSMQMVGTGKTVSPSTIVIPTPVAMKTLGIGSLAFTALGTNYVSNFTIRELEWGWNNNPDLNDSFYPGSGTQDGYNLRGAILAGDRSCSLRAKVLVQAGSPEYTALKNQTTGTAVVTQTFDANNTYTATFHKVGMEAVQVSTNAAGLLMFDLVFSPYRHATNGLLTVVAKCQVDAIGE